MRTVDTIAPGVAEFEAVGGITFIGAADPVSAKCELCGEWSDGPRPAMATWARHHARDAHDARPPSVLGLDTSLTRAGIAIASRDPKRDTFWPSLLSHVGEAGSQDATYAERGRRLVRQVRAIMAIVDAAQRAGADIRLGVIEGPSYGNSSMPSYYDRAGLWWAVVAGLQARGIPFAVVAPDHRAKFICGVKPPPGPSGKKLVLDETRQRWGSARTTDVIADPARLVANHDQADALGVAEMGVLGAEWSVPWQVRRRHVENVHLVTWPEITA